ncbi:hypothetical protein KDM41_18040, partial [bacterium]|nr:hypothetical protein [bacterium]
MSTRSLRLATGLALLGLVLAGPALGRENVLRLAWGPSGDAFMATTDSVPAVLTGRLLIDDAVPSTLVTRITFKFNALGGDVLAVVSPYGDVVEVAPANWELTATTPFNLVWDGTTELATFQFLVTDPGRVDVLLYSGKATRETGVTWDLVPPFGDYEIYVGWVNAGQPELEVSPLLFPPRGINREPALDYALVRNVGDGPFFFATTGLGDPCGPFRITNAAGMDLVYIRPFGSRSLAIEFDPVTEGDFACSLPLGGGEFQPVLGVGRLPIHALSPTPAVLDFGGVAVGGLGRVTFQVTNTGDFTESMAGLVSGDGTPLVAESIVGLQPGWTYPYDLEYTPADYDPHAWTVNYGGLFSVSATAYGIDGELAATVFPDTLRLAVVNSEPSNVRSFRLRNTGTVGFTPAPTWTGDAAPFALVDFTPELILPNGYTDIYVRFDGQDTDEHRALLDLGPGLPVVPIFGRRLLDQAALEVRPQTLVMPPAAVGDTVTGSFSVQNIGNRYVTLDLVADDPHLEIVGAVSGLSVGTYRTFSVRCIATAYEQIDARVVVSYELGVDVSVVGPPVHPFGADENRLSLYFDETFGTPDTTVPLAPQVVPAWLVLRNPSESGGVAGWSCRLATSAGASLINAAPTGTVFDAAAAMDEFSVTVLGAPLPGAAAIVLAQAQVLVLDP